MLKHALAAAVVCTIALLFFSAEAEANEVEGNAVEETAEIAPHEHEAHEFHRHHVAILFGGATTSEEHRNDRHGFVGGLDYEYRFSRWVGVGAVMEGAAGNLRDGVFVGSVFLHPWKGLLLGVGPGLEFGSNGTEYLTRFAIAYQIPLWRRFSIAPDFSVDLVKTQPIYVYGVALGIGF